MKKIEYRIIPAAIMHWKTVLSLLKDVLTDDRFFPLYFLVMGCQRRCVLGCSSFIFHMISSLISYIYTNIIYIDSDIVVSVGEDHNPGVFFAKNTADIIKINLSVF